MPPIQGPFIAEIGTGSLVGEYSFAAARYDSARQIYSDLVWITEPLTEEDIDDVEEEAGVSIDPLIPKLIGESNTFPDETFIGTSSGLTTRKALRIRDMSLMGAAPRNGAQTVKYTAVTLWLRATAVTESLLGNIYVVINGIQSEKMDVTKLTTTLTAYRFAFNTPITYAPTPHETEPAIIKSIEVRWDTPSGTMPTSTRIMVRCTEADSRVNDLILESEAAYDSVSGLIVPTQGKLFANAFSAEVDDTDTDVQTEALTFFGNQAATSASTNAKMVTASPKRGFLGPTTDSNGNPLDGAVYGSDITTLAFRWSKKNNDLNTLPYVTRGDLSNMIGKVVTVFPSTFPNETSLNFRYAVRGRVASVTYSSNDLTNGTLSSDFSSPTTRVVRGEIVLKNWVWMTRMARRASGGIEVQNNAAIVFGFPDHGSGSLHDEGRRVEYQNTGNSWVFTGGGGGNGTAVDIIYMEFETDAVQGGTGPGTGTGGEASPNPLAPDSTLGPIAIYNFDGEDGGAVTFANWSRLRGDEFTDQYDSFALLVFSLSAGEIYVASILPKTQSETVTIDNINPVGSEVYVPYNNTPLVAGRKVAAFTYLGNTTLATAGQVGYDCFIDQPTVWAFTPDGALESNGVLTVVDPLVNSGVIINGNLRDGTYLATTYDTEGNLVSRTFIAEEVPDGYGGYVDLSGDPLEDNQIQLCTDQLRTEVIIQDVGLNDDFSSLRVEIKRQVIAHVQKGSRLVRLTHDFEGNLPARVGKQYWSQHGFAVAGIDGDGLITKVATWDGDYRGSLDNTDEYGDCVVLESPWAGASGEGLMVVFPRAKTVFFGKSGLVSFEQTGLNYNFDLKSNMPVQTMEVAGDKLVVITEANDIFSLSPIAAGIADPRSFDQAITFNIRQFFRDTRYTYPFSCVSAATWSFPTDRIGFIGSEGPNVFDFVSVYNLLDDNDETWDEFSRASLRKTVAAVDPQHPYAPSIRIAGMVEQDETKRNQQLVMIPSKSMWLNFEDQCQNIDAMTTITMQNGNRRVLFGGNGRLYLYGNSPKKDRNQYPLDLHLFPYIGGLQYGSVLSSTPNGEGLYTIRASEAVPYDVDDPSTFGKQFQSLQDGYAFKDSNIRVAKWDAEGNVEWATAVARVSYRDLQVEPDSTWTFSSSTTYKFIVGALPWKISFPKVVPTNPYIDVSLESFGFDIKDYSSFDWPYKVKIYGSGDDPNIDSVLLDTITFTKSDMNPTWRREEVQLGPDYSFKLEAEGIRPPDASMFIRGVMMKVRFTLGDP
jgi:YD repeat-containing protein